MNTDTFQSLQDWLHGRHYNISRDGNQLTLTRGGKTMAVVTPPDRYQVSAVDMNFDEWVEFNKCIRNIRHYLTTQDSKNLLS